MRIRAFLLAFLPACSLGLAALADEPASWRRRKRSGSFLTRTGKGPSSRRAKSTWRWACPTSSRRCACSREQPSFRFTLDQVAYVRPFLERYPAEEADFRRFLAEGRLQLAGALDVMPDVNMPGGETFVRQMQYGKGYYRDKLGVDVTTGLAHRHASATTPSCRNCSPRPVTSRSGSSAACTRQNHPSEFFWEGIDGTRIPAFYLPAWLRPHVWIAQ